MLFEIVLNVLENFMMIDVWYLCRIAQLFLEVIHLENVLIEIVDEHVSLLLNKIVELMHFFEEVFELILNEHLWGVRGNLGWHALVWRDVARGEPICDIINQFFINFLVLINVHNDEEKNEGENNHSYQMSPNIHQIMMGFEQGFNQIPETVVHSIASMHVVFLNHPIRCILFVNDFALFSWILALHYN